MKTVLNILAAVAGAGCIFLSCAAVAEDAPARPEAERLTSFEFIQRGVSGGRDSAKFEQFRDVPSGLVGTYELEYRRGARHYEALWDNIGRHDQHVSFNGGIQGQYRVKLFYDQIPHRFAYDALTLFSGEGTGDLTIPNSIRNSFQSLPGTTTGAELATMLENALETSGSLKDVWLKRSTFGANVDLVVNNPLNLRLELRNERREGTRPFFGSFGFNNTVELLEPIDYTTTDISLIAEYAVPHRYVNAMFNSSRFNNNIGILSWDNPFRVTDSSTPQSFSHTFQSGAARGIMDLYPDNRFHSFSVTGVASDLPYRGSVTGSVAIGRMRQENDLLAYTSNTAVMGRDGEATFDASDRANLPVGRLDAKVNTTTYNLQYHMRPQNNSSVRARYRMYEYDNKTPLIEFPGYVRTDAVWVDHAVSALPISHKQQNMSLDWQQRLMPGTSLTVAFDNEVMSRRFREVARSKENTYSLRVDHRRHGWFSLHGAYEHSRRRWSDYDFRAPFPGEATPPQIPLLRKYDQANRNRDQLRLMATAVPVENLSITCSVGYAKDNYIDSPFGLTRSKRYDYSLDTDYTFPSGVSLFAFASRERYDSDQWARQWSTPGAPGYPFAPPDDGFESSMNWAAFSQDNITALGGGIVVPLAPRKVNFRLTGTYARSNGSIHFGGPLAHDVATPVLDFNTVDSTNMRTIDAQIQYIVSRSVGISLGYLWEAFSIRDISQGAPYVPRSGDPLTGNYGGALLMGTMPQDYNVHIVYGRLNYNF